MEKLAKTTAAFAHAPFQPSFSFERDSAILHALAWSVQTKFHALNHAPPNASGEQRDVEREIERGWVSRRVRIRAFSSV